MNRYVVFDLEMCRVSKGESRKAFGYNMELIQIGAVLLNGEYEIQDTFVTYVHPEFGSIDTFIENLTGISRCDVAHAPNASEAISEFLRWVPADATLVSWSANDIKQLRMEISGKGIDVGDSIGVLDNWVDCQQIFGEKLNSNRLFKLSEALNMTELYYEDGEHDALVDAKNTAMLFRKVETENTLKLSPYLMFECDYCSGNYNRTGLMPGLVIA